MRLAWKAKRARHEGDELIEVEEDHPLDDLLAHPLGLQVVPQHLGHPGDRVQFVHEPQQEVLSRREGGGLGIGRVRAATASSVSPAQRRKGPRARPMRTT